MRSLAANMPLKSFAKLITKGKGKWYAPLYSLLSTGNIKLPKTTAIFNLSSAHECPSFRLGLCRAFDSKGRHVCYARKAERGLYPNVQPRRDKQMAFWLTCTAEEFAWQLLLINSLKEKPYTHLRFNESGDFHMQACVAKAERIATIIKPYGIKAYGYTCRSDLDYTSVKNLILSGTGFEKEGISNVFLIVDDVKDRPKGYGVCCGDCSVCNRCMVRGNKTVVKRH